MDKLPESSSVRYCGWQNMILRGNLYSQIFFEMYWWFYLGYKSKFWVFQFKLCLTPWLKNRWKLYLFKIRKGFYFLLIHYHNLHIHFCLFQIIIAMTSTPFPRSKCVTAQPLVLGPKGWKIKLLKFEWNFRGEWVRTINDLPWNNFIWNHP